MKENQNNEVVLKQLHFEVQCQIPNFTLKIERQSWKLGEISIFVVFFKVHFMADEKNLLFSGCDSLVFYDMGVLCSHKLILTCRKGKGKGAR